MRATITIDDDRLAELMALTGATHRTEAINLAIDEYVRRAKVQRLLGLAGRVAILSNDEIEAMDEGTYRGWYASAPGEVAVR
ncbi:MAG: type II toxin-antitoxin system VapB family antitoxin [Trueperaceae bacterium]|nr:type II toxin-antitoxin system VapB family antitoxin [Trueperaceae bacterium]